MESSRAIFPAREALVVGLARRLHSCYTAAMTLMTTEYLIRCLDSKGSIWTEHGPYLALNMAKLKLRWLQTMVDEAYWGSRDKWIILERTVTDWEPIPTEPPTFHPEDD